MRWKLLQFSTKEGGMVRCQLKFHIYDGSHIPAGGPVLPVSASAFSLRSSRVAVFHAIVCVQSHGNLVET
eukprot:4355231-Amphidinium_carterae.1